MLSEWYSENSRIGLWKRSGDVSKWEGYRKAVILLIKRRKTIPHFESVQVQMAIGGWRLHAARTSLLASRFSPVATWRVPWMVSRPWGIDGIDEKCAKKGQPSKIPILGTINKILLYPINFVYFGIAPGSPSNEATAGNCSRSCNGPWHTECQLFPGSHTLSEGMILIERVNFAKGVWGPYLAEHHKRHCVSWDFAAYYPLYPCMAIFLTAEADWVLWYLHYCDCESTMFSIQKLFVQQSRLDEICYVVSPAVVLRPYAIASSR